jgi:peptide/nickel transport system substrate-binding protein
VHATRDAVDRLATDPNYRPNIRLSLSAPMAHWHLSDPIICGPHQAIDQESWRSLECATSRNWKVKGMNRLRGTAIRRIVMIAVGMALVLSAEAITPSSGAGAASNGGGVLKVGYPFSDGINPVAFDPTQFSGGACCFTYDWPIYAGLLRQTTSDAYVPDLASSVSIPNPSTLDIQLRPDLVYSNGATLDAAAVKAGFQRNMTNPRSAEINQTLSDISSINVKGTDSLTLRFSSPVAASFYPLLADQESFMALPTGPSNGTPNTNIVGAGPFVMKSYTPDESLVLVKNPKYWDASAIHLSGITFVNVPSGPQQVNALESGLVNVQGVPVSDLPVLKSQPDLQVYSDFPDANYYFVPICKSSGPLASVQVRQALNYAVNRVAINNALLYGKGQPAWSLFPSTSAFYDTSLTGIYAYNVKKAKQLLAAAGYPKGFSTTIMALPESDTNQLATVLQSEWAQIGVKVTIVQSSNYVTDLYADNKAQMGLNPAGLPGIGKLTTQFIPNHKGDLCNYDNPTLDALTNEIQSLPPTSPKLKAAWTQAQDIVVKDALGVYIDYAPVVTGGSASVRNLSDIPYPGGVPNYWVMSVSS